jgi:hypothetical protein
MGNDDEWEMFMQPFVNKIRKLQKKHRIGKLHAEEWKFLRKWRTELNEENLEKVPKQGEKDARVSSHHSLQRASSLTSCDFRTTGGTSGLHLDICYQMGLNPRPWRTTAARSTTALFLSKFGPLRQTAISSRPRTSSRVHSLRSTPAKKAKVTERRSSSSRCLTSEKSGVEASPLMYVFIDLNPLS